MVDSSKSENDNYFGTKGVCLEKSERFVEKAMYLEKVERLIVWNIG